MNRRHFTILTALMWSALPLTAMRYAMVWDQLPANMATHFNAAGQPNGWMTRQTSLYFGLGLTAFTLIVFTVLAIAIRQMKKEKLGVESYALMAFFYLILGFVFYGNESVIRYNLTGQPVRVAPVLIGVPVAIVVLTLIFLRSKRGQALPEGQTLAEETHGSKVFGGLFLFIALMQLSIAFLIPQAGVRLGMSLLGVFFLLVAAHAWQGFRYRFTPAGIEISTLGFRLRSIPRAQIANYRPEKWMVLRGYGIRGLGSTRAYVWGNDVVHITTLDGEVFLGTHDPARVVRDLDMMKQYSHS